MESSQWENEICSFVVKFSSVQILLFVYICIIVGYQ